MSDTLSNAALRQLKKKKKKGTLTEEEQKIYDQHLGVKDRYANWSLEFSNIDPSLV